METIHKTKTMSRSEIRSLFNARMTICNKVVAPDEVHNIWDKVTCANCISASRKVTLRKKVITIQSNYYKTHYKNSNCKRRSPYNYEETDDKSKVTCKYCLKAMKGK